MEIDKIRAENKRFQDDLNIALTANAALEAESAELKILVCRNFRLLDYLYCYAFMITLINCKLDYRNKNLFNLKRFAFVILLNLFQGYSRRIIVVEIHFSFGDSALPRM